MKNIVITFTKDEITRILNKSNFTLQEKQLFVLRNQEKTLEEIAEIMNISERTAGRINKRVIEKINHLKTP